MTSPIFFNSFSHEIFLSFKKLKCCYLHWKYLHKNEETIWWAYQILGTPNICPLDLKTISSALLHSLLSSTWNGTNSERICSIMEMTLNYAYVIKTVIFVLYIIVVLIPNHWRLVKTFLNHKRGGSEWGAQRWSSAMCTVS